MRVSWAAVAVALILAAGAPRAAAAEWRDIYDEPTLAVAAGADFPALIENPSEIHFGKRVRPSEGIYVASYADVHAVYPVPLERLRETVLDLDRHDEFVPRVVGSSARRIGDDPPRWRQDVELSFRVLFFRRDYGFETEHVVADRTEDNGRFALRFQMVESRDDTLADSGGSWYLERVEIDGSEYTYVRYFNRVAFSRRVFGLRLALRNFGLRDVKSVMDAYYREARSRAQ